MDKKIRRVLLIVNQMKEQARAATEEARVYFQDRGVDLLVVPVNGRIAAEQLEGTDIAVTMGGDGTLLYCARILAGANIPILPVNLGDFGFITEVSKDEWVDAFEAYQSGRLGISCRVMFRVRVLRDGEQVARFRGLNDAVIQSSGISRIIRLRLYLAHTYVGRYRADGVIFSTPTGSTAYSMAAGGPILHPEMDAFVLNPICPFTLSNRPMVVPGNEHLELEVERQQRTEIVLNVDGQEVFPLQPADRIIFGRSQKSTLIIQSNRRNFYEVVRAKLNWAGEPNA
jgi:NAD+ kinase